MPLAFARAARLYAQADVSDPLGNGNDTQHEQPYIDRPVITQPDVATDSLDPAAVAGPAPMNSGQGPYGDPVADDPLLSSPIQPGAPIPHLNGPDQDTSVLH
jgi:hypothetical protein